jgi:hypothetical protein
VQGARGTGAGAGSGRSTPAQLCFDENLPIADAIARLAARGIQADGKQTLREIAIGAGYGRPSELLPIIRGTAGPN